ncbi:MAG: hypothetical protein AAFV53_12940 [Myxococcota bacterium]
MTRQTLAERRFGAVMLILGLSGLVLGMGLMVSGDTGWALGGPGRLAVGGCALMAGIEPRRHRPYALPAAIGLTAAALFSVGQGWWTQCVGDGLAAALCWVTIWQAKASINGAWLRGGPPIG